MSNLTSPYIIEIQLKKNLEQCEDVMVLLRRTLITSAFEAKDGPQRLVYVKQEKGSASAVLKRYEAISNHPDVAVFRVFTANPNYASSLGILDPISAKLDVAWAHMRKRREADNLARAYGAPVKNKKRTTRKSRMRRGRYRKAPQQANK